MNCFGQQRLKAKVITEETSLVRNSLDPWKLLVRAVFIDEISFGRLDQSVPIL